MLYCCHDCYYPPSICEKNSDGGGIADGPQRPLATPQAGDLRGNYNPKSGLITVSIESGIDIKIVTTDAVPGKKCEALETQFPVMVLPTSGSLGGRTLADGAIRGMKSLRQAAVEAGANSVVGLRTAPYITRNGNPRIFVYGTLANCE